MRIIYFVSWHMYLIFCTQEKHRDIRLKVVNLVINNWEMHKEFVIGDIFRLLFDVTAV